MHNRGDLDQLHSIIPFEDITARVVSCAIILAEPLVPQLDDVKLDVLRPGA